MDCIGEPGLGSKATLFGSPEDKGQDGEKLMDLYWNRAELKKSFAAARNEHFRLQDKIKQQEGVTARVQQKLDYLEALLIDTQSTFSVVVYYQLRGLALRCEDKLATFAEQLKQEQEKTQRRGEMSYWNTKLAEESKHVEGKLLKQRGHLKHLKADHTAMQQKLSSMGGFKRLFKGRSVKAGLRKLEQQFELTRAAEQSLLADLSGITQRKPPETAGLDVSNKRSINFLILAYAQQLYLHFADKAFAESVMEAGDKSVGAINYGNQYECTQMLDEIRKRIEIMDRGTDFASISGKRAELIGDRASFKDDSDVVPLAASTNTLFDIDDDGAVTEHKINILGDNYWGIAKVLSR